MLATFLVKDVFRDWLKGLSDSIVAAQNVESEGQAQSVLLLEQERLSLAQRQLSTVLASPQETPAISQVNLQAEVATLQQLCAQAAKDVEATSAVLNKLPQRGEGARYLRGRRDELRKELDKLQKEGQRTATINLVSSPSWQNHVSVLLGIVAVGAFELNVVLWHIEVASAAKRTKEAADRLYELCTWLFYFLYVAGVGIALWGALLGGEAIPGD